MLDYQADASTILSPRLYREVLIEGELSERELDEFLEALDPRALAIHAGRRPNDAAQKCRGVAMMR